MEIKISYRHLESTPSIDEKINKKVTKLKKFFSGKMAVEWICSVEGDNHHSVVTVVGDHFTYHASSVEDSLYKTIDGAVSKLERQLEKKSSQIKEKIHKN